MNPRFFVDAPLFEGASFELPEQAARHVQVLRLQPGSGITLFNGLGAPDGASIAGRGSDPEKATAPDAGNAGRDGVEGEFDATVEHMGRKEVRVIIRGFSATRRELPRAVHLAVGMPANDRMDWLVEKATELGAASIWPLMAERSVLRLKGDRADKKIAHWRGIAAAACEQCRRNRVPGILDASSLMAWLAGLPREAAGAGGGRWLLSLQEGAQPLQRALAAAPALQALTFLSGPEGGLSPVEEAAAVAAGFSPVTLGARVLRAETAPLAVLAALGLCGVA